MANALEPVHPGEVLLEEFLRPLEISQYRLAQDTSVPPRRINEIVHGKRSISADTALRLARFFGTSEMFWLNLQARYDLDVERQRVGSRLDREVKRSLPASPIQRDSMRTVSVRVAASRSGKPAVARSSRKAK